MPVFEYQALSSNGNTVSDIIDADSMDEAKRKMRAEGLYPVHVRPGPTPVETSRPGGIHLFRPLFIRNTVFLSVFTRQLATLVESGFPIVTALTSLAEQASTPPLKKMLFQIKDVVSAGSTLASALNHFSGVFPPLYRCMVDAGEASGSLDIVLVQLAEYYEKEQALRQKTKAALAYPALMALVCAGVLLFLLTYVLPGLASLFAEMDIALPPPTQLLLDAADFVRTWWPLGAALLICPGILFVVCRERPGTRRILDTCALRIPVVGQLMRKAAVGRLARTLGALLASGLDMLSALQIAGATAGNRVIAASIARAVEAVETGMGLAHALERDRVLPPLAVDMMRVGEDTGKLDTVLIKLADIYETEVESETLKFTSLLEPALILLMGTVVGFIVLSICLPIIDMNRLIQ
jgi:general secretion pathway protein F